MKRLLLLTLSFGLSLSLTAQHKKLPVNGSAQLIKTANPILPKPLEGRFIGFRNPASLDLNWQPALSSIISKNESEYKQMLRKIKEEKAKLKQQDIDMSGQAKSTIGAPALSTNFDGLTPQGNNSPLDNTIAISNGGIIVSMVNSRIAYYNSSGTPTFNQTIYDLINDNQISNNVCDPKVIYSNTDDRFIIFAQTCDGVASTSAIILGFSKTNNPADGWNFYYFTGNPLQDGSWFDYPKIAVSNDEVFVSGNLFFQGGGFNEAIVYQIQKAPCFAGGTTNAQFWSGIAGNPFTLLPVSWGQTGNYGPGIYLVSTAGVTTGSTNINLYDITDNQAASNEQMLGYNISTTSYSVPADAPQPGGGKNLDVGDCRSLDGFYLNGIIHFVFNCDAGNSWSGINYNRLNVSTGINVSSVYGESGTADNCYPGVASIANSQTDKSVIIAYNRVSSTTFPETRVIACDDAMTWSPSTLVKAGAGKIDHSWSTGSTERWGDYIGICRKYNDNPASVWMAGTYGNTNEYWSTRIAKILNTPVSIATTEKDETAAKVYPNPIIDNYYVEFELPAKQTVNISVIDAQGRLVKELHNGTAFAGRNVFSFNKANLNAGTYFLKISDNTRIIKNEKILVVSQ